MRHVLKMAFALVTVMSVSASAVEPCTPTPPKDLEGRIELAPGPTSFAATYFEGNGCDWAGNEALNGTDALVLEVDGLAGTGTVTGTGVLTPVHVALTAYFLDGNCARVGEDFAFDTFSNTFALTFPEGGKWLVMHKNDNNPARDISVAVHFDGKDCAVEEPPAKKKKKKNKKGG